MRKRIGMTLGELRKNLSGRLGNPWLARWVAPLRTLRQLLGWRPPRVPVTEARRILVIRPDKIGDVVFTSPFLRELRRAAPNAYIMLLVNPWCRDLVEHCPYVDSVHSLPFGISARLVLRAWLLRWRHVGIKGFDLVLAPRYDTYWGDNAELAGHILAGRGAVVVHRHPPGATEPAPVGLEVYTNPHIEQKALHALRFLRWCGAAEAEDSHLELWLDDADRAFAAAWLGRRLTRRAPLVVLHPSGGGRGWLGRWPVARYKALLNALAEETLCDFLIVGGSDEPWIREEFASETCERLAIGLGEFTVRQLGAVLEQARLFVGGDSGPLHVAAAAGTRVIGIFGPSNERRYAPLTPHGRVVSLRYPCSPSARGVFDATCFACRFSEPRCLTRLPVEMVLDEVRAMLRGEKDPPRPGRPSFAEPLRPHAEL